MNRKWSTWILAVVLGLAVAIPLSVAGGQTRAPGGEPQGKARGANTTLLVFAATSLAVALEPEAIRFQAQSGIRVRIAYASSSLLARQIAFGARADLYISAHQRWLDFLAARELLDPVAPTALFSNRLVLASARRALAPVTLKPGLDITALLDTGLLAMGDPDYVPVGIYGKSALEWLGAWDALAKRIARADNARAALAMVERGEVALGLVYLTDARQVGLNIVGIFPQASHAPIVYGAGIVANSQNRRAASRFIAYLKSPAPGARFTALGYTVQPGEGGK